MSTCEIGDRSGESWPFEPASALRLWAGAANVQTLHIANAIKNDLYLLPKSICP